jgi:hypothetical protein
MPVCHFLQNQYLRQEDSTASTMFKQLKFCFVAVIQFEVQFQTIILGTVCGRKKSPIWEANKFESGSSFCRILYLSDIIIIIMFMKD